MSNGCQRQRMTDEDEGEEEEDLCETSLSWRGDGSGHMIEG